MQKHSEQTKILGSVPCVLAPCHDLDPGPYHLHLCPYQPWSCHEAALGLTSPEARAWLEALPLALAWALPLTLAWSCPGLVFVYPIHKQLFWFQPFLTFRLIARGCRALSLANWTRLVLNSVKPITQAKFRVMSASQLGTSWQYCFC